MNLQILKKWKPILNILNIDDKNQEVVATYAESHMVLESAGSIQENLLPVNLKVMSRLDFDKIKVSEEKFLGDVIEVSEKMTKDNFDSITTISNTENILLDRLVELLNDKGNITIHRLVSEVGVRNNKQGSFPEMYMISQVDYN